MMAEPETPEVNENQNDSSQTKLYDRIDNLLGQLESDPAPEPEVQEPPPPQAYISEGSVGAGFQSFFANPERPILNIDSMKNNKRLDSIMEEIEVERGRKRKLDNMQLNAESKKTKYNQFGLYALVMVAMGVVLKVLTTSVSMKRAYDDHVRKKPLF